MKYIIIYFAVINALAFLIYSLDKKKARNRQWRISENTLLFLAVIGGSIGAFAAMEVLHHKTRKAKFKIGIPVLMILQILGSVWYFCS